MKNWPTMTMAQITTLVTDGKHGDCEDEEDSGYFFLSSKDLRPEEQFRRCQFPSERTNEVGKLAFGGD